MRGKSGGRWRSAFALASTLALGCGSSASGTSSEAGGASDAGGNAVGGSSAQPGGSNAGGTHDPQGGVTQAGDAGGASESDASDAGDAGRAGDAVNMFIDQVVIGQGGGPPRCLPRSLPTGLPGTANDGQASCIVAELKAAPCDCLQPARAALPTSSLSAMEKQLQANGACGGNSGIGCDTICGCEITQAVGTASDQSSALYACQNEVTVAAGVNGFCVIDQLRTDAAGAPAPLGDPDIVSQCPSNWKRLLRFVGAGTPASDASVFLSCTGAAL